MPGRVFISCGQAHEPERRAAAEISDALTAAGFQPYVAIQAQSILDVNSGIGRVPRLPLHEPRTGNRVRLCIREGHFPSPKGHPTRRLFGLYGIKRHRVRTCRGCASVGHASRYDPKVDRQLHAPFGRVQPALVEQPDQIRPILRTISLHRYREPPSRCCSVRYRRPAVMLYDG